MSPYAEWVLTQFHAALGKASGAQRLAIQRAVIDLFLAAASYSERQVAMFSGVMGLLIDKLDRKALLELSSRLAAAPHAPLLVIGRLSWSDDIAVAGPVLEKSKVLGDENLVEIARTKGQDHLLAIAGREQVSESVTDALVDRGNTNVTQKVVSNSGARLSELGFAKVVHEAGSDEILAAMLAGRTDVPPELQPFLQLAREPVKPPATVNSPRTSAPVAAKSRPQEKWMPISRSSSGGWDR